MAIGGKARIQLQLQNARQVIGGLQQTGAAVGALAKQTHAYNAGVTQAQHRTFLMNQTLFTMRRFAYAGTLALGGLAAASTRLGLHFNISMEQNTIAMEHFLGSSGAATRELEYLFNVAKTTPFEFQQIVDAERRFLAFGFSVDEARSALSTIGDVAAGLGGESADNIERLVLVLGQVRATGRVLGQDMLQLQQLGINTNQIFRDELGLTREQLKNGVGELQIPAEVAIPALLRGMQKQFDGMAAKQAMTLGGMLSTLHDNTSQLMGNLTHGVFDRLRTSIIPSFISLTDELSLAAKHGATMADMMGIIDSHIGAHGALASIWRTLSNVFAAAGAVFRNLLIPSLRFSAMIVGPVLVPALEILSRVLLFAADHSAILAPLIVYLTVSFVAYKIALILSTIWTLRQGLAWKLAILSGMKFGGAIRFLTILTYRGVAALRAWAFATVVARSSLGTFMTVYARNGLFARGTRFVWGLVIATRAWAASNLLVGRTFLMIPIIGWIAAIITAFIILEVKLHLVERLVRGLWGLFRRFKNWISGNKVSWGDFLPSGDMPNWVRFIPGVGQTLGGISTFRSLTGLADGGVVSRGGAFMVGEGGPEIAMLPRGSAVRPIGSNAVPLNAESIDIVAEIRNIFEVDGEKLEEKLSRVRLNKKARR